MPTEDLTVKQSTVQDSTAQNSPAMMFFSFSSLIKLFMSAMLKNAQNDSLYLQQHRIKNIVELYTLLRNAIQSAASGVCRHIKIGLHRFDRMSESK